MKTSTFLFVLLLVDLMTFSQSKIIGRVSDQHNNPLVGATVYLPELNKGTITDCEGEYSLKNIPKGRITIQFSFLGYLTEVRSILASDTLARIDIRLSEAVIQSQEVVVTGGYVSSQHENAVKIDVLRSKDFSWLGTPNFTETLTQIPGVDMISKGQGVAKPVIRGLSMNDILVMNHGVRIENYQYGENHPIGIDGNDVERVEIIKGPASLLYGSDAIGGVINFIKEKPAPTHQLVGDYGIQLHSNTLGLNQSVGLKGRLDKLYGGIRLGHKTHSDYIQGNGDFVPNTRFNERSLNAHTGYSASNGSFRLYYDYFEQDLGMSVPAAISLISEADRTNQIWYQDLAYQLLSSQNSLYIRKFKWELNASYQSAQRKLQTLEKAPFVEMNLNTFSYESKVYFPSDKGQEYILGIQGMLQTNSNKNDRESQFLPDANRNNLGFLGLIKYSLFNQLKLQGGFRYDYFQTETYALGAPESFNYQAPVNRLFGSFSGSIGATYSPQDEWMLRLNLAKGFRVPTLSELTSHGLHGNRYEIGNDQLVPQNSLETDVSVHYHGHYLSFDLAAFHNRIDQYIFISPSNDTTLTGVPIFHFSQTNALLYGGEAGVHFHPEQIPWLHVESTFSSVIGKQENGHFLPFIPANKLRYEIRAEHKRIGFWDKPNIKISVLTAFAQNHPSPFETATPSYTLINLSSYFEMVVAKQRIQVGIAVNNILDIQYIDHLSTLKPLNFFNQGRNVSLSIKVPFGINLESH